MTVLNNNNSTSAHSKVHPLTAPTLVKQKEKSEKTKRNEQKVTLNKKESVSKNPKKVLLANISSPKMDADIKVTEQSNGRGGENIFITIADVMDNMTNADMINIKDGTIQIQFDNQKNQNFQVEIQGENKQLNSDLYKMQHPPKMPLWKKILFPILAIVAVPLLAGVGSVVLDGLGEIADVVATGAKRLMGVTQDLESVIDTSLEEVETAEATAKEASTLSRLGSRIGNDFSRVGKLGYTMAAIGGGVTGTNLTLHEASTEKQNAISYAQTEFTKANTEITAIESDISTNNQDINQEFFTNIQNPYSEENTEEGMLGAAMQQWVSTYTKSAQ